MQFNQGEFNNFIIEHDVIGFHEKPVTLKSGRLSYWYVNWRSITADAFLLDRLTDFINSFLRKHRTSARSFLGVPEGATKTAIVLSYKIARSSPIYEKGSHPLVMGRAIPKNHGAPADKYYIGVPEGETIVLEDTSTTGSSLFVAIDRVIESGLDYKGALLLTDRSQKNNRGESLEQAYVAKYPDHPLLVMSRASELLPLIAKRRKPSAAIIENIEKEFSAYGVAPIQLHH